ncbi:tRNA lysidine(34) synthetase TilS [Macrococcoides canis]|uniref:tRNA lysidine(34) synthetase TilS n=1 Tax=Macrococcoides canis TaxID=1855823 RepID=UPI00207D3D8E|nr:tRNA lysidine(34) synthetase TilS [Macrococcus canis]MCO4097390.1 tRNA lysidine(34) synthetase TilS [Macrococcus canis]UTH09143.1 tRNA lysidine(34) synthetase TilS [Macrococcus canis]
MKRFWNEDDRIGVAVSGGVDSMVLLDKVRQSGCFKQLYVLHVNHQLREASQEEQLMLQRYCTLHEIELIAYTIPHGTFDLSKSIQHPARKLRYAFFERVAKEKGISWILTAHHKDDQLETIFFRLLSNRFTFQPPNMQMIVKGAVSYGKPLLNYSKSELYQYAEREGVPFMEDASNREIKYTRNYIRNEIIDKLDEAKLSKENLLHVARYIDSAQSLIEQCAMQYSEDIEINSIDRTMLRKENHLVQQYVIQSLLSRFMNGESIGVHQVDEIIRVMKTESTHASYSFGEYTLHMAYNHITVRKHEEKNSYLRISLPGKYKFNEYIIQVNHLKSDIIVRNRQDGDMLSIDGHHQKVSRIMKDLKVPIYERNTIPLIIYEGETIAVGNLKSSNHFMNQHIKISKEY